MTKKEIIEMLVAKLDAKKKEAEEVYEAIISTIIKGMKEDKETNLKDFGKFVIVDKPAREGKNPFTGEKIKIPAKRAIKFKPAKNLKELFIKK